MSRADRRQAERIQRRKIQPSRRVHPEYALTVLRSVLELNTVERVSEQDRDMFMLPAYAQLQQMVSGQLERDGYYLLSEYIVFGLYLCHELIVTTKGDAKVQLENARSWLLESRDTLANIAERYNRISKFGASGEELKDLQESIGLIDSLVLLGDKRHVERANSRTQRAMQELHRLQHAAEIRQSA